MYKKLVFALLLSVQAAVVLAADSLKVGLSADYPPLHYEQDGRIVGIEADNATAVSKILGRERRLVTLEGDRLTAYAFAPMIANDTSDEPSGRGDEEG